MVPGAVAEWIDASSFRHEPMVQVSAFKNGKATVVFRFLTAVRMVYIVGSGTALAALVSIFVSVRTHQVASVILY